MTPIIRLVPLIYQNLLIIPRQMKSKFLIVIVPCLLLVSGMSAIDSALIDNRFCMSILRDPDGTIHRRNDVLVAFRKLYPCPSTGLKAGKCSGWAIDHVRPLASCGCDAVSNLQWLPNEIKSGPGTLPKDRWERRVYTCAMR